MRKRWIKLPWIKVCFFLFLLGACQDTENEDPLLIQPKPEAIRLAWSGTAVILEPPLLEADPQALRLEVKGSALPDNLKIHIEGACYLEREASATSTQQVFTPNAECAQLGILKWHLFSFSTTVNGAEIVVYHKESNNQWNSIVSSTPISSLTLPEHTQASVSIIPIPPTTLPSFLLNSTTTSLPSATTTSTTLFPGLNPSTTLLTGLNTSTTLSISSLPPTTLPPDNIINSPFQPVFTTTTNLPNVPRLTTTSTSVPRPTTTLPNVPLTINPSAPTVADAVQVQFTLGLPNPCYEVTTKVTREGSLIRLDNTLVPFQGICVAMIDFRKLTVDLGTLPVGSYLLRVYHSENNLSGVLEFSVRPAP